MSEKVSVIVPVYNVENYLERCVKSLLTQTYKNLEIILVDDGSKDRSGILCDEYAQRHPCIIAIHKNNGGLSSARNFGMKYATGSIISYVDSDDWLEENFYEELVEKLIEYQADIAIAGVNYRYLNSTIYTDVTYLQRGNGKDAIYELLTGGKYFGNAVWNRIYRRNIVNNLFFPEGKLYEDVLFSIQVFARTKRYVISGATAYNYVVEREGSIMNSIVKEQHITDAVYLYDARTEILKNNHMEELIPLNDLAEIRNIVCSYYELYRNAEIKDKRTIRNELIDCLNTVKARKNQMGLVISLILAMKYMPHVLYYMIRLYMKKRGVIR